VKTISAQMATAGMSALLLATTLAAQSSDQEAAPSQVPPEQVSSAPVSKVRIVRLSEVKGDVQLDRNTGRGFEPATANLPIVEKNRLQTGTGVAEVEFEDNSTLRLAPDSAVEFPKLERLPGGTTASSVLVLKGMAYVSLMKTPGNEFDLLFGQQMLRLPPASHIRLQLGDTEAKVAVLDGTVHINGPGGGADVPKKKTVTLPLQDQAQPEVTKDVASNPLDSWDKDSVGYHQRSAIASNYGNSGYAYGLSDMMYYGSFMNAGGCGSMWRPYFASADWEPYSNGAWAYYGGAGYSWVSPYPWGWTPYHYGSWGFCPGAGWGWQPGGLWNGLNNTALLTPRGGSGGGGPVRVPIAPSRPPAPGAPTLSAVNLKPPVRSDVASANSFVFRKDSAGLGVPRDSLGKLDRFSQHTIERGTASTNIYVSAPAVAQGNARATNSPVVPTAIHRGSAPSSAGEASSNRGSFGGSAGGSAGSSSPTASAPAHTASRGH
jgi:hypothetical protein